MYRLYVVYRGEVCPALRDVGKSSEGKRLITIHSKIYGRIRVPMEMVEPLEYR